MFITIVKILLRTCMKITFKKIYSNVSITFSNTETKYLSNNNFSTISSFKFETTVYQ